MKIKVINSLNKKAEYSEETHQLSGLLVMSVNGCCLCCNDGTGGDLFCK